MGRRLHGIELGILLVAENADTGLSIIRGSIVPNGGLADDALIGSMYLRDNGETYKKNASGTGADKWVKMATIDDVTSINWRPELVRALTATAAPSEGGTVDASALSDDDGSLTGADFAIGEYIAFGSGGTEVLGKITGIASDDLTISYLGFDALADNDMLLVRKYLPDAAGQENSALVFYTGTDYVKVADFDWSLATGINLSSGYAAATGDVAAGDTVEVAIQKIDGNVDALEDAVGVAQGDTNMGAYSGSTVLTDNTSAKANIQELGNEAVSIRTAVGTTGSNMGTYTGDLLNDNETAKQNIQQLETAIEDAAKQVTSASITTEVSLDEILVDNCKMAAWEVFISLDSAPERVKSFEIMATHNGHASADATSVDDTVFGKLKIGAAFNAVVSVDLNGAGASQYMRLRVSASAAVTAWARRRIVG